jgi:surface-anchored protein
MKILLKQQKKNFVFRASMGVIVIGLMGRAVGSAQTNYMAGHADVSISYNDGNWNVHYRFGGDTILNGSYATITNAAPENIHVIVPNNANTRIVLNSNQVNGAYSFLGATAGRTNYYLSQSTVPGEPFFGLGTDELQYNQFTGPIKFRLTSFSGPGNFSSWQNDTFGNPLVAWTTANGLGNDDVVSFGLPTHAHYNWGFTEPGEYILGITVTGTNNTVGVLSSTKNIVFEVAPFATPSLTIQQNAPSNIVVSLPTVPSQLYQLQSATNVAGPWNNAGAQFAGNGLTNQVMRTNALSQEFFRVQTHR